MAAAIDCQCRLHRPAGPGRPRVLAAGRDEFCSVTMDGRHSDESGLVSRAIRSYSLRRQALQRPIGTSIMQDPSYFFSARPYRQAVDPFYGAKLRTANIWRKRQLCESKFSGGKLRGRHWTKRLSRPLCDTQPCSVDPEPHWALHRPEERRLRPPTKWRDPSVRRAVTRQTRRLCGSRCGNLVPCLAPCLGP